MTILTNSIDSVRAVSATSETWQSEMRQAVRSAADVAAAVGLSGEIPELTAVENFPVFAPRPYLQRIQQGNVDDPLLRQIWPLSEEDQSVPGFTSDPLHESTMTRASGLLQKYAGRVLLVLTGACAIHCRYCFRREFPYSDSPRGMEQWEPVFRQIESDSSISEVLLSGGDPLTLVDEKLKLVYDRLQAIDHLKRVRIHTRLPVVIPSRVTEELLQILACSRLSTVFVIHSNHANELDSSVARALQILRPVVSQLLNQAVLLRGVNDHPETLRQHCERLLEVGVLPYYLHQLDPVSGAAHFQVPVSKGKQLIQQLRETLPGYAVPRYAQEVPGEKNKTILA